MGGPWISRNSTLPGSEVVGSLVGPPPCRRERRERAPSRGPGGQGPRPFRERRAREVGPPMVTGPLTAGGPFSFSFGPAGRHHAGSGPVMTDDRVLGEHPMTKVYRIEVSFVRRHPPSVPVHRAAGHLGELRRHRSRRVGALPNRRREPPAPCRHMTDTEQTLR